MSIYLYIILAYLFVLTALNFLRARRIKSQDDFMVAGRRLGWPVMVFTLICTWIGSGTFISGAEFASKAGFSALWLAAGAWVGIILIYFLAGKIHTFGQYTIGDILEVRYGPVARLVGAVALLMSFTAIVSYQFVAGGFILNVATDGRISDSAGTVIAAAFVILFTALGGMVAIAYTDLPNGIIIVLACLLAVRSSISRREAPPKPASRSVRAIFRPSTASSAPTRRSRPWAIFSPPCSCCWAFRACTRNSTAPGRRRTPRKPWSGGRWVRSSSKPWSS